MKKVLLSVLFVLFLTSCTFFSKHPNIDVQWEDNQGNVIYYNWDIFGDAAVEYKNAAGKITKLRNYAYSDSFERMNIYVSENSRNVCLLVYKTTNSKYKTGSVLHIIELSESKDCILNETIIDDINLSNTLTMTDSLVTYYDINGNCYYYAFE